MCGCASQQHGDRRPWGTGGHQACWKLDPQRVYSGLLQAAGAQAWVLAAGVLAGDVWGIPKSCGVRGQRMRTVLREASHCGGTTGRQASGGQGPMALALPQNPTGGHGLAGPEGARGAER